MCSLHVLNQQEDYLSMKMLSSISPIEKQLKPCITSEDNQTPQYLELQDVVTFADKNCFNNTIPEYLYLEDVNSVSSENHYHQYWTVEHHNLLVVFIKRQKKLLISAASLCTFIIAIMLATFVYWKLTKTNFTLQSQQNDLYCINKETEDQQMDCRQAFVRDMFIDAFKTYQRFAWGAAEMRPISKKRFVYEGIGNYPGVTIIDSMSTLWVMELKNEWAEGKKWITKLMPNLAYNENNLRVREGIVDYLGGLLSAYFLSGEAEFLVKAKEVADALKPAFYDITGMLSYSFNPKGELPNTTVVPSTSTVNAKNKQRDHQQIKYNFLEFIGFQQPELIAITNLTGDQYLLNQLAKNRHFIKHIHLFKGLYLRRINVSTGNWSSDWSQINIPQDFLQNMLLSYLLLGENKDNEILKMFSQTVDDALTNNQFSLHNLNGQRIYINEYNTEKLWFRSYTWSEYCLYGGTFALSSAIFNKFNPKPVKAQTYLQLAINIINNCHDVVNRTQTKLLPIEYDEVQIVNNQSSLFPFLAEPYFYLYRITGDAKYREWAWEHALALYRHARVDSGGYSYIVDLNSAPTVKFDYQQAAFLSGTLKYLYLIFSKPSILPLDKWIFTSRGHPFPICGTNDLYSKKLCLQVVNK